jgi:pantoate--beta-alanine ligase
LQHAGFTVEYLEVREAESLAVTTEVTASSRVFAAVRLGKTRLIDNMPIAPAALFPQT